MNELYQGRKINVVAELDLDADCWIPRADVVWEENGRQNHQHLTGPNGFFKIIDEAQIYALEMAKSWIDADAQFIDPRSPNKTPKTTERRVRRYVANPNPSQSLRR